MSLPALACISPCMGDTHKDTLYMSQQAVLSSRDSAIRARQSAREMAIRSGDTCLLVTMSRVLIEESDRAIASYGTLASYPMSPASGRPNDSAR
jgi:hypothetical protein